MMYKQNTYGRKNRFNSCRNQLPSFPLPFELSHFEDRMDRNDGEDMKNRQNRKDGKNRKDMVYRKDMEYGKKRKDIKDIENWKFRKNREFGVQGIQVRLRM